MRHLDIKIYGSVHGVNFRRCAKQEADGLGISGFIRNETDGTVYIEAEGKEKDLNFFLDWCCQGSRWARVEKVEHKFSEKLKNFDCFEIRH